MDTEVVQGGDRVRLFTRRCNKFPPHILTARISKRLEILLCKISSGSGNGAELAQQDPYRCRNFEILIQII